MSTSYTRLVGAILVVAAGCSPPAQVGRAGGAIINGVESGPEDDAAVALPIFGPGGGFQSACTGVLVAPNVLLTARHCVSQVEGSGIACGEDGSPIQGGGVLGDFEPSQLSVLLGPKLDFNNFEFAASGKKIIHSGSTNLCNNDFAIVILDKKIENAKIAPIRLESPPVAGEMILAVGWGQSNNSSGFGRRRRADIPITAVGSYFSATDGIILGPNEFGVGESICQGDSGGPAFDQKTGAVIGVVSRGGNGDFDNMDPTVACVDHDRFVSRNIYTRTDTFKQLILDAFAEAEAEPWYENGPDPRKAKFGEACDSDDACRSNKCHEGMCTDLCDGPEATTCPEGFVCRDLSGGFICAVPPPPSGCSTSGRAPASGFALTLLAFAGLLLRQRRLRRAP